MDLLDQLQAAVTSASERVGPSVIGLGRGWGRGSGVVIAPGRVLTSAHVLRGDEVAVRRGDGEVALGSVAGADPDLDVAVIAVDTGEAPAVVWEPDAVEQLSAGQPVFALADPGGRGLRTSFGLVTATSSPRSTCALVSTRPSAITTPEPRPQPRPRPTTAGPTRPATAPTAVCSSSRNPVIAIPRSHLLITSH